MPTEPLLPGSLGKGSQPPPPVPPYPEEPPPEPYRWLLEEELTVPEQVAYLAPVVVILAALVAFVR